MNPSEILERFDRDRREVVYPHMRRETAPGLVQHLSLIEDEMKIKWSSFASDELPDAIAAETERARRETRELE